MRLIIVRHGETVENLKGITQGHNDGKLSVLGTKQARKLGKRLLKVKIDMAYCSDLGRCKETLKPYVKVTKMKVHYTRLLREMGKGFLEGGRGEVSKKWHQDNPGKRPRGGENWEDVRKRVLKFINKNLKIWKGKTVLIMTHGGTKQVFLNVLFGKGKKHLIEHREKIKEISPHTGVTIISFDDNGDYVIDELLSDEHLEKIK